MNKRLTLMLMLLACVITASAQTRSQQEMRHIAFQKLQSMHGDANLSRSSSVADSHVDVLMQDPMYTVMGSDDMGFVIVSNDQRQQPVLAYSDKAFDKINIPCGMQWWLNAVSEMLQKQLTTGQFETSANHRAPKSRVEPLMTSHWDQDDPYNKLCPAIDNKLTPSGCVATALAQVLYFYKYPDSSQGEGYYTVGESSKQYDVTLNSTYDWSLFQDSYVSAIFLSDEKKAAIAQLLFDCGAAVHMHYDTGSSGALQSLIGSALSYNFKCDSLSVRALHRNFFDNDEWMQIIRTELEAGRPVMYGGQDASSGGHAFVIHGIDEEDFVYVNWGWSGKGDCWTNIDILRPEDRNYSFSDDQEMVIGLRTTPIPAEGEKYQSCWGMKEPETFSLNMFKRLQVSEFLAYNCHHLAFYGTVGLYFEKTDGSENVLLPYIKTGEDVEPVEVGIGYRFNSQSFFLSELSVGTYYAYMASKSVQEDTPQPIRHAGGKINVYTITINADRSVTIDNTEELNEVPTAIHEVRVDNGTQRKDVRIYDLQGREVKTPSKGLYIKDGKKIMY